MIKQRGDHLTLTPAVFNQLEIRYHFLSEVMKKKLLGYVCLGTIYLLYREEGSLIKVPFARNRLYFRAMASDPEFAALMRLPQIYVN